MFKYTKKKSSIIVCTAGILFFVMMPKMALAFFESAKVKDGNKAYLKGDFDGSIRQYENVLKKKPEWDILNFDLGTAYYKKGDYKKAQDYLQKALLTEKNDLKAKAHYNLGNAYYRGGIAQEEKNIDQAIASLDQSLGHYEQNLLQNKDDNDSKYNSDFVQKELERLKKKKQQQGSQQQQQKDKEKEQNKEDQKNKDQSEQSKEQQSQKKEGNSSEEKQSQSSEQKKDEQGKAVDQDKVQEQKEGSQKKDDATSQRQEQDKKENKDRSAQSASTEEKKDVAQKKETSRVGDEKGELTKKEAEMILNNYQQNKEPKGLFNVLKQKSSSQPVGKDW